MKTFEDLNFKKHPVAEESYLFRNAIQALMFFPNGYGVSVVTGAPGTLYCNKGTYEVAVLKGAREKWDLCYDTPITNDVKGWQTPEDVTDIMRQVQELPSESQHYESLH